MVSFKPTNISTYKLINQHGDDRPRQRIIFAMCKSRANDLVKSLELLNAKNLVAKAKGILSPFYGMKDFAPVYALA